MGTCLTKPKFNKLDYPSYCTMELATYDDQLLCFESWSVAVRTRNELDRFPGDDYGRKSFDVLKRKFESYLKKQNVVEPLPEDFLICLISTIVHGRSHRTASFKNYGLKPATWSAIGTALFMSLRALHEPIPWTERTQTAWIRCFSAIMRAILDKSLTKNKRSNSLYAIPLTPK